MLCRPVFVAITAAVMLTVFVDALPFGANSGVTELTPKTLPGFLNTHKPVFIVFYAPWCGHCKAIHPEWEKFAKGVKDVVRVGAVNADQYKELGSQFGIQGFPTIKFWKMGNKKGMKPQDYQGARTASAMQNAAVAEISSKQVISVADEDAVKSALTKSSSNKAVILFTNKNKSPPIFSVLSQSPHFSGKISFLLAPSTSKKLATSFEVSKFPTLMVVSTDDNGNLARELYEGNIDYTSIAKHLQGVLGIEAKDEPASGKTEEETKKKKPSKSAEGSEEKPAEEKRAPKASLPVRPVPLNPQMFAPYCAQGSMKIRGQQPLCVVSFAKVDLEALHGKYSNEAFLFFDGTAADESILEKLTAQLGSNVEVGDVVLLRAFKADAGKFYVVKGASDDSLDATLDKLAGGELTLNKLDKFVTLIDG